MPFTDETAERRISRAACDGCSVREVRFYDQSGFDGSELLQWEHDWQRVRLGGRLGSVEMAFHSRECLATYLSKELNRAYPDPKVAT